MDPVHIHLTINHVPLFATIIGTLVLIYGMVSKERAVTRIALMIYVGAALSVIPVLNSGEEAEERIEDLPGIEESYIHEHEEMAEWAIYFVFALGAVALVNLLLKGGKWSKHLALLSFALASVVIVLFLRLGYLGGQIRHSEIRKDNPAPVQVDRIGERAGEMEYEEDDD